MRRLLAVSLLAGLGLTPAAPALADPDPPQPDHRPPEARSEPGDCARARKAGRACELTIEPEQVGGSRPDPGGTDLRVRPFLPIGSLLRLRRDFIAEIVNSADDL